MSELKTHIAPGQALGYFFQLDRALSQIAKAPLGTLVGIETEDDIVVKLTSGEKIHEQDKSSTTVFPFLPSKPDIWKTLCIWADGIQSGEINIDSTQFLLVTNKTLVDCPAKTIHDAIEDKSATICLSELKAFKDKTNATTKKYIDQLFSYNDTLLITLIKRISLITGELIVGDALKTELISSLQIVDGDDDDKISIINEIYGWLFNQVRDAWQNTKPAWIERDALVRYKNKILSNRIEALFNEKILETREITEPEKELHKLKNYVKQLKLVELKDSQIVDAIGDFLNSIEKRTQLAKKGYLTEAEIKIMIQNLKIRWQTIFERIQIIYKKNTKEDQGKLICLDTLDHNAKMGQVETRGYFLTRGTYHHLADSLEVGWHPDYINLLKDKEIK